MTKAMPNGRSGGSRRQRHRRELLTEIGEVTRDLVVEDGPPAVTMAAVAERVGVTAPALYRYVDGRTGLLELGCATVARELTAHMQSVRDAMAPEPLGRVLGLFREFRRWALAHRAEFALVFAHPATAFERADRDELMNLDPASAETSAALAIVAELELEWVFEEALVRLWLERPFPVPDDAELSPELVAGMDQFIARVRRRTVDAGITVEAAPTAAAAILLGHWVRVYGMISMEVFGHLSYALEDAGPLFEFVLDELVRVVEG